MNARRDQLRPAESPLTSQRASRRSKRLRMNVLALFAVGCALTSSFGCALTSKSEPIEPHYYSPERSGAPTKQAPAAAAIGPAAELRLGHVGAASYLDERMVYRDSDYELGYYEEKRWTEPPEEYLRRRLERTLFEERGLRHVVSGSAATLDVELTAFEEIRKPKHIARVRVSVRLQDGRLVRWEQSLTVDQPVAEVDEELQAEEVAKAVGMALGSVVDQIADRVAKDLATPPPAPLPEEPKK